MKLKTCECGACEGYMVFINKYGNNYEVACINCGRKTALKTTRQQAINAWNKRNENKKMSNDRLSIFISLILRHKPEEAGITLDKHGWANVEELIKGINNTGRKIDKGTLEEIVRTDNKGRYSFNEDKTLIRANQGHSIPVDVELKEVVPPAILYHGTATKSLDKIKQQGIKAMSRLYVHLSKDLETAVNVGDRHGKCVVLVIDTNRMFEDGIKFYLSENNVWLTTYIDWKYVKEIKYIND